MAINWAVIDFNFFQKSVLLSIALALREALECSLKPVDPLVRATSAKSASSSDNLSSMEKAAAQCEIIASSH